jgi:flavin-dependent dehydrogenase
MDRIENCDVAVIGGGPAGTTAATMLSRRGWDVTLFEKNTHPRFHIGESLLPMNVPIFEELGILQQIRDIGVLKLAADFTPNKETVEFNTFSFYEALGETPDFAFQVRRSEFDQLLFKTCRKAGTNAVEDCTVTQVELNKSQPHRVHVETQAGTRRVWDCRYVLDASGQSAVLARQQRWRIHNRRHASAAVFSHFEGVQLRDSEASGNISIYWFDHGWIWMIPLTGGIMSVGAVCGPELLKNRAGLRDQFLETSIRQCAGARERLKNARRIMPAQYAANYSYFSRKQIGPGYGLIGDAYAFVDPVFSTGVYLAMSSATRIIPVVECWLNGEYGRYKRKSRDYCKQINGAINVFSWFIYRFMTPAMAGLFRNPRNILGVKRAVISMLSGDVYDSWGIRIRLVGFKCIFAISKLVHIVRASLTRQASFSEK